MRTALLGCASTLRTKLFMSIDLMLQSPLFTNEQLTGANKSVPQLALAFRSGMSRSKDFWAAADAGVPVGVVAGELGFAMRLIGIPRFLRDGGHLFIDSGAFAELRTGIAPDFENVLSLYESICEAAEGCSFSLSQLYVVAPDKVGDQLATLERLRSYATRLRAMMDAGCMVIVPIQRGAMPAAAMLDQVAAILGSRRFVAGIPSNKEALSIEECATLKHRRFHILGRVQLNHDQAARMDALATLNPTAAITADANWLRGRIAEVSALATTVRRERSKHKEVYQAHSPRATAIIATIARDTGWSNPC